MPKRRYERREPTHDWQQIRPLLKDMAQINYEVIRPVVLWGQTPMEYRANLSFVADYLADRANILANDTNNALQSCKSQDSAALVDMLWRDFRTREVARPGCRPGRAFRRGRKISN
jgi:hypothetical protein